MSYSNVRDAIAEEMEKTCPDKAKLLRLHPATFQERRKRILTVKDSIVRGVIRECPLLAEATYVS